jgi:7-cyano-7-deazaguanine synthase
MSDLPHAIVLVSGGLDSCVTAAIAAQDHRLSFLHVAYGQRTQAREHLAFTQIGDHYGIEERRVVDVAYLSDIGGSSLTDRRLEVERGDEAEQQTAVPSTYVPFRNANLLAIAVSWAEVTGATAVYLGAHEMGAPYPDCQTAFFEAFNALVSVGTRPQTRLEIVTPILALDKAGIVARGVDLGAPLHLTWSCYTAQNHPCGTCHSCLSRRAGFESAGIPDPLLGT